jgi:hypothetical protein
MHPFPDQTRRDVLPIGTPVAVRTRYQDAWSNGFEVVRVTGDGYWLRRESDRYLLPRAFVADDVRRRS